MAQEQDDDLIWRTAWDWVRREHDRENFGEGSRVEMVAWLLADPAHRKAYDKAARLWLLAGLVPPIVDVDAWKKNQNRATPEDAAPSDDDA
jgi:transmembrane sensor